MAFSKIDRSLQPQEVRLSLPVSPVVSHRALGFPQLPYLVQVATGNNGFAHGLLLTGSGTITRSPGQVGG